MSKNLTPIIIIGVALVALFVLIVYPQIGGSGANLEAFAKCLAEKKITMYGAEWCSRCQNEKRAFGSSFKYVPYIECPDEPQKCISAGVDAYPTWTLSDGTKLVGEQGLQKLSEVSGCVLPME